MDTSISYTVTVYNELEELKTLLPLLQTAKTNNDEIIVVHTFKTEEEKNTDIDKAITDVCRNVDVYKRYNFDNKFAEMKNFVNSIATKEYIINFDADEFASPETINYWKLAITPQYDLYHIPRVNTVSGYTIEDINDYKWQINQNGWINWPDYQPRLYKNHCDIKWTGNVHEQLVNFKQQIALPADPRYAIIHHKDIERQRRQNALYETIQR